MFVDLGLVLEFLQLVIELKAQLDDLEAILTAETPPLFADWTYEQRKEFLKKITILAVNLQLDVNCYPMGHNTALIFDLNGEPVAE